MIRVFSPNDKVFNSNGDSVIQPFKANMLKIGSITIDDVPDALKDEVKKLMNEHSEQSEPTSDSK